MNSEAEKNPVLNIRQELEELAEAWEEEYSELSEHSMQGVTFRNCAAELRQVIQRIHEGWELRPREPTEGTPEDQGNIVAAKGNDCGDKECPLRGLPHAHHHGSEQSDAPKN